ncbi:MAG: 4Fe-4S binding protein [Eubacteriaceae bacterium]|nr:4Fe-4S binding protein [Eubacteriaceae bacterium]
MDIINFSKANCKNCYKCVRSCQIKSIKVKDGQAQIDNDLCIGCGTCLTICPQNAKSIISDLPYIQSLIHNNAKVAVSLAPSFPSAFAGDDPLKVITALKLLGFSIVEETSIGAELVSDEYYKLYRDSEAKHIITTSCPTINYLFETYYPEKLKYLAPVVSPMITHGKILRRKYPDHKLVFIGPCISKKFEASKTEGTHYDGVITFDELNHWLEYRGMDITKLEPSDPDSSDCGNARFYPLAGGVIKSTFKEESHDRKIFKVDGLSDAIDLIESLEQDYDHKTWIEMNACHEGCINGPGNTLSPYGKSRRSDKVKDYIENMPQSEITPSPAKFADLNLSRNFQDRSIKLPLPSEAEIKEILMDIGKHTREDELNCGTCGYDTCREKAVAVFQGMAEKEMCLPFMRSKGETLSNLIISSTPNGILVTDKFFNIIEFNPSAEKIFERRARDMVFSSALVFLKDLDFDRIKSYPNTIKDEVIYLADFDLYIKYTILYMVDQELYIFIVNDITKQTKGKERIRQMRDNALGMAQEVIDKQMRVAQEIASLLGETTAETKVTLTQLKKLVQRENGD